MQKALILFTCIAFIFVGCKNENSKDNNSKKDHDHIDPLSYTVYTDKTELFVEFDPLISGKTTKFAAHFTKLGSNFKAIKEGSVSLKLVGEKDQPSFKADSPKSPGIFRLLLKPINSGTYKLVFILNTNTYSDTITIDNVIVYPNVKSATDNHIHKKEDEEISYLKEQAWKIDFANTKAIKQPFSEIIKTTGHILPAQGDEVIITAKSNGIITFGNHRKLIGSSVNSNETLFNITGGDLTENNIDNEYHSSKIYYEKSKSDYERAQELIKENIISEKKFQNIQLEYQNAKNTFNTIAKNYNAMGKKITSPINGFIKNIMVNEGQYVQVGEPIARVSQNQKLILKAEVPQRHYSKLNSISSANFKTVYNNKVYNTDSLNGQFISYGKSTNEHAYFIPVNFEIDNKGDIIPGSFIEIYLKTNIIKDVIAIPYSALLEEQGHYYAYIQTSGESFQKRELKLGINDGLKIQVLSGISENERVVTKGAYQIKLSTMSGKLPEHGHEH